MTIRALVAAFALAALTLLPHPTFSATAPARAARPAASRAAMPDTVLARIDFSPGRVSLTSGDFLRAVAKFGANGDSLAPSDRHEVLGMMVQQAVLDHRIAQAPPRWLRRDSTAYSNYEDGTLLRAALDSALAGMRSQLLARRDTVPARRALISLARDSTLARMHVVYDNAAIDTLTAAFAALPADDATLPSSRRREILSQMPHVTARDSASALGSFEAGSYSMGDLLRDRAAMGLTNRPAVTTTQDVRNLVDDALYAMLLRREAKRQHLELRPDLAAMLATRRQFLTAQRFVQNEAYDQVAVDTATVRAWFDREVRRYDVPANAQILRTLSPSREGADSLVTRLASKRYADSLLTGSLRPGIPYLATLTEDADTVLFARVTAAGIGGVIGPDPTPDGWRVFRVITMTPRKPQTLEQVFARARADWIESDGDRRMRAMMAKLTAACHVTTNESSSYLTGRRRGTR